MESSLFIGKVFATLEKTLSKVAGVDVEVEPNFSKDGLHIWWTGSDESVVEDIEKCLGKKLTDVYYCDEYNETNACIMF